MPFDSRNVCRPRWMSDVSIIAIVSSATNSLAHVNQMALCRAFSPSAFAVSMHRVVILTVFRYPLSSFHLDLLPKGRVFITPDTNTTPRTMCTRHQRFVARLFSTRPHLTWPCTETLPRSATPRAARKPWTERSEFYGPCTQRCEVIASLSVGPARYRCGLGALDTVLQIFKGF